MIRNIIGSELVSKLVAAFRKNTYGYKPWKTCIYELKMIVVYEYKQLKVKLEHYLLVISYKKMASPSGDSSRD